MRKQVFAWREANRFELLLDGNRFFPALLQAIDRAQYRIELELYLLEAGDCADRVLAHLVAAAERGVQVRCLFDHFGSRGLGVARLQQLAQQVDLRFYNPLSWRRGLNNLYRDHRKLVLIDGQLGFVGGAGLTDEFWQPQGNASNWHELMVSMQGPVLQDWLSLFERQWQAAVHSMPWKVRSPLPGASSRRLPTWPQGNQGYGRVAYASADQHQDILRGLLWALHTGQQRIWFATPYFLPTWRVRRALRKAAKSGVDVRLLTASRHTDNPPVRYAGQRYYPKLLRAGVRIYEYQPRFLHLKMVLVDDWLSLGSCNFDHWNLRFNLDANLEARDQHLVEQVEQCFLTDFSQSLEITRQSWKQRSPWLRIKQRFWGWFDRLVVNVFYGGK